MTTRLGNKPGWAIAAIVLIAEVAVVGWATSLDATTPPTAIGRDDRSFAPLALPVDPSTVVATDQPGDAGAIYRAVAADYLADAGAYEAFLRDHDRGRIDGLAALPKLLAATRLSGGAIHADAAGIDAVIVYGDAPAIVALSRVGRAAIDAGLLVERSEPDRARALFEAAFSLGARLSAERLTYREFAAGTELMSVAAACLAEQAKREGRTDDAQRVVRFANAHRAHLHEQVRPTVEALLTNDESRIATHAGDVFAFARRADGERMWRVEAILKLGRMRHNPGSPGRASDARQATRLVTRMAAAEDDPVIRRAATVARDLTVEQFRTLR